ncbi:MAG: hypothetical protein JWL65_6942 [Gammaproteobacteria bacterium]|nr:hypothetical protein [Gammaproteobacteria bacterium]
MMRGSVSISTSDGSIDLRALAAWLREDDIFRGKIRLDEEPINLGHMGGLIGEIIIAVGGGGVANTLIRQLFTWLEKRGDRHAAHLTLKDGTGREASLDVSGLDNPDAIMHRVFEFFSSGK